MTAAALTEGVSLQGGDRFPVLPNTAKNDFEHFLVPMQPEMKMVPSRTHVGEALAVHQEYQCLDDLFLSA